MWPVDSMTTSTPRPFVKLETACTPVSPPGVVTSAPNRSASERFHALRVIPITSVAPRAFASCA